ncbi:MAG: glycine/betaine ABC transporter substrate-binding protein [Actinomycetota bacterium]|nr:glycine/betaine ABC transporter substrate-binding protein [Actinomycetota bacterium]
MSFTVGSKEFTEQLIMGQITLMALENAGAEVTDETGITGTVNVRKALDNGEIDTYWEYTGTGYAEILQNEIAEAPTDPQELFDAVAEQDLKNNVQWTALTTVNNTYALATATATQEELGVSTLSDYASLVGSDPDSASLCAASEFINRADGLPGVAEAYGFDPAQVPTTEVELAIVFTRVPEGDPCNFGEVFATDGAIADNDMVVLEDDKAFFPIYNLALTVNKDVYDENAEGIDAVFTPIAEALDTDTLRELNRQVQVDGLLPEEVAEMWLTDNGFIG